MPTLPLPVLFVVGGRDLMIRSGRIRRIARTLPDGRVLVVPGTSHFVHVESADEVNAALADFFMEGDLTPLGAG